MRGIVLPLVTSTSITTDVRAIAALNVRIAVEVVVHVYVDVVATPTTTPAPTTATPRRAHGQTDTERNRARRNDSACRGWVINWRIWISRRAVNNGGIVRRHVNNLRVRLFDHNHFFAFDHLGLNYLLLVRRQRSCAFCFSSHALHRIHHIALLREKGIAEIGGPLNIVG